MSLPYQRLMPRIWKGRGAKGMGMAHRVQIIGDKNEPVSFCAKQPMEYISRSPTSGALCGRCDWSDT